MKDLVRVQKILELFKEKGELTGSFICEQLGDESGAISYETWNRLRKKLIEELNIPIVYNRKSKAYLLSEAIEDGERLDVLSLNKFIENYEVISLLMKKAGEDIDAIKYIEFEQQTCLYNISFFNTLLTAIQKRLEVKLTHKGYYNSQARESIGRPLYFKQYQNRWYLIAEINNEFLSFGLDRIQQVELTKKKFIPKLEEAKTLFSEIVGLNHSDSDRQRIVIEFDIKQKPYVLSLPLHHTQNIIKEGKSTFQIEIWVRPNYELQQQIQKYGNFAKVVEGDWVCL